MDNFVIGESLKGKILKVHPQRTRGSKNFAQNVGPWGKLRCSSNSIPKFFHDNFLCSLNFSIWIIYFMKTPGKQIFRLIRLKKYYQILKENSRVFFSCHWEKIKTTSQLNKTFLFFTRNNFHSSQETIFTVHKTPTHMRYCLTDPYSCVSARAPEFFFVRITRLLLAHMHYYPELTKNAFPWEV